MVAINKKGTGTFYQKNKGQTPCSGLVGIYGVSPNFSTVPICAPVAQEDRATVS